MKSIEVTLKLVGDNVKDLRKSCTVDIALTGGTDLHILTHIKESLLDSKQGLFNPVPGLFTLMLGRFTGMSPFLSTGTPYFYSGSRM